MANYDNLKPLKTAIDRRLSGVKATEEHIAHVLHAAQGRRRVSARTLAVALALMAVLTTALAVTWPTTVRWIQGMFGDGWANELQSGVLMEIHQTKVLGEVQYEWLEAIHVGEAGEEKPAFFYADNSLFGSVRITPIEGANIVLLPEDTEPTMFPGYNRHKGEMAPQGAPSYLDLALERQAKMIMAKAVPHGILIDGKLQEEYEIMYDYSSHPDGSLLYHFQIPMVHASREYTIRLRLNNWEVTRDGAWLREEPHDTWLKDDWTITIRPGER